MVHGHSLFTFPSPCWAGRTWLQCCLVMNLVRESINLPNSSSHERSSDYPLHLSALLNPQCAYSQRGCICTEFSGGGWAECWHAHAWFSLWTHKLPFFFLSFFVFFWPKVRDELMYAAFRVHMVVLIGLCTQLEWRFGFKLECDMWDRVLQMCTTSITETRLMELCLVL